MSSAPRPVVVFGRAGAGAQARELPLEVAIALSYNGSTRAVMMATPADLEDFARGFTVSEGIAEAREIERIEVVDTTLGIDLQIWLVPVAATRHATRQRRQIGPVGCGLCGIESLEQAMEPVLPVARHAFSLTPEQVHAAMAALSAAQPLHAATRAVHAAGFWHPATGLMALREDVGRHNALDKLAGALTRFDQSPDEGVLVLTCRISLDMVQKAARIGAGFVISPSPPTAAAVDLAQAAGITVIGHVREGGFAVYSHPQYLKDATDAE